MSGDAFGGDFHPLEALVSHSDFHIRRLADDSGIRFPGTDEGVSPDAGVFFVDDRRKDQTAGRQSTTFGEV